MMDDAKFMEPEEAQIFVKKVNSIGMLFFKESPEERVNMLAALTAIILCNTIQDLSSENMDKYNEAVMHYCKETLQREII